MIKENNKSRAEERRKAPRAKWAFNIELLDNNIKTIVRVVNISSAGIYCESEKEIPLFREIQVTVKLPEIDKTLECSGVVVRSERIPKKDCFNLAIYFDDITPKDKGLLAEYIGKKLKK